MTNGDPTQTGKKPPFKLWKPTIWCYVRRALLSESFAWGVQNASGLLFAILFALIGKMTFSLACVSACLYSAASTVLSLDRTVGGRFFGASLFVGCMLSSGILGGALSTLAWVAAGNEMGFLEYLPAAFQKIPSKTDIALLLEWIPKLAGIPLPGFIRDEIAAAEAELRAVEEALIPSVDSLFWILLIVFFAIIALPFSVARANKDFRLEVVMAVATLFMGSQIVFATLIPTLGVRLYWTQISMGYVKVALVTACAMLVTALLFFAKSSHDSIRDQLGVLLQGTGALLSHSGSVLAFSGGNNKDDDGQTGLINRSGDGGDSGGGSTGVQSISLEAISEEFKKESRALAGAPPPSFFHEGEEIVMGGDGGITPLAAAGTAAGTTDEEAIQNGGFTFPAPPKSALELHGDARGITATFASALFEPPLLGVASQPGAVRAHYEKVLSSVEKLIGVAGSIDSCSMQAYLEILHGEKISTELAETTRDTISFILASCAAVCGDLSVALRHMPFYGLSWKNQVIVVAWSPRDLSFWESLRCQLRSNASALEKVATAEGTDAVELAFMEGRAILAVLASCEQLIEMGMAVERDAAVALKIKVPLSISSEPPLLANDSTPDGVISPVVDTTAAAAAGDLKAVVNGDQDDGSGVVVENLVVLSPPGGGKLNEEGDQDQKAAALAVAPSPSPPPPKKLSLKEKIIQNAYAPGFLVIFAIGLGIPVWALVIKAILDIFRGIKNFIHGTSASRSAMLRDRNFQFAMKFWIGMALAMMGIVLLLWQGKASTGDPLQDIHDLDAFFFIWQPIYFWITAAICVQKKVEAAVFRAVLRSTMTVLGGTLGYCTMLNGDLAQNPYFVASITALFNGVVALLCPIKSLRYSIFLTAFTFNAVVVCQFLGCCGIAGDPKIYGGKVLSTLFGSIYAMIVSWCFFPYYTSSVMLADEADALQTAVKLIEKQHMWMVSVAQGTTATTEGTTTTTTTAKQEWDQAIEEGLREPLSRVRKELENNVLDRKQIMLMWNVLPTPPVVHILLEKICNLADCLETAGNVGECSLWPGEPGPAQKALLDHLHPCIAAVQSSAERVVAVSCECMSETSLHELHSIRSRLSDAVVELRAARTSLRGNFLSWKLPPSQKGTKETQKEEEGEEEEEKRPLWTGPDYRFMAWLHFMLEAVREVEVIGVVLAETEAALDRDGLFSWARSYLGRRPI